MKTDRQKYVIDLWIAALSWAVSFGALGIFYMWLKLDLSRLPLLGQTLIAALTEFGAMGLGPVLICLRNRERFSSFGLKKEKLLITLLLSALVCLPSLVHAQWLKGGSVTYFPLQGVNFTTSILRSAFPVNVVGMLIIIIAWGFFEGFTFVVLSDRINRLFPPKNFFRNWGAISCGIFCILLHLLLGQSYDIFGAVSEFILIYGMLVIYRYTSNAWGCIFIFLFFWSSLA